FVYETVNAIRLKFDHDLDQSSVSVSDVDVVLLPGGAVFHPASVTFPDSKTALFQFAVPLADGNYHATLLSGSVQDVAGVAIAAASDLEFFALTADANHDRHVDATDQAILSAHLNQAGTFSTGDFDLNGAVDSADQAVLTSALSLWLPPVGAVALPATGGDDVYALKRESGALMDVYAGADVAPTYRLIVAGVTSLSFAGDAGNDALIVDASNGLSMGSIPLSFDGGNSGTDALGIIGTSGADDVTFDSTSVVIGSTIACTGIESRSFDGGGGGDSLAINDVEVSLSKSQELASLALNGDGTLDVRDHALAIDYDGATPMSVLAAAIENGRDGGAWDGAGIVTSMSAAKTPGALTALGIAEANDVVNFGGGQTAIWDGQTVDTTAVLIRYTYAGDANLDGVINGDDYFDIDAGYASQATGYLNGDFNYDGRVDADDYFLIDANYGHAQSPPAGGAVAQAFSRASEEVRKAAVDWGQGDVSAYRRLIEDGAGPIV